MHKVKKQQLLLLSAYIDDDSHIGGVTMHVHRMIKRLIEPHIHDYVLCDYKRDGLLVQLRKIKKADIMHIHASNAYLKLLYVLAGKLLGTKSLITVHGKYGVYGLIGNCVHKIALKMCNVPILINKESYAEVKTFNPRAVYIPVFIPPIEEEENLSPEMEKKINTIKSDGKKLFVTNASSRAFTADGHEIYGIDFLVDYFKMHPEWNLVILDPSNEYCPLYDGKTPKNVKIFNGHHSFCGLVRLADVVIRNTPTDGDSISVKEAMFLNKPVLATDAVSRPEGVFLFKYNDWDSLTSAIGKVFSYGGKIDLNEKDATNAYYELYKKMWVI